MNKTKRIASVLLTLAVFFSCFSIATIQANAKIIEKKTGDCYYTYNTSTKVMRIYGNGKMGEFEYFSGTPEENMKKLIVEEGVTYIDGYAFDGCEKLAKVTISSTVKKINKNRFGGESFYGNLKEITVSKNNKKYSSKGGVLFNKKKTVLYQYPPSKSTKSYKVPKSVKTISGYAFHQSANLKNVTMGDKVTKVGKYAFSYCWYLKTVKMSKNVKTISKSAFEGCGYLTKITLSKNLKKIGAAAFYYCESISGYIGLPDSVTEVGDVAFYNCTELKGVVTTNKLKKLGYHCFGYIDNRTAPLDKNYTIYGKSGSAAHKYAKKNKIKFVII